MEPSEWMHRFKITHEQAKAGKLKEAEHKAYLDMREELARSLIAAQSLQVPKGEFSRKHFRVAQMYKLEIANTYQSMTRQVSVKGFSANLQAQFKVGQELDFALHVQRETDPITGKAKVVSVQKQGALHLVSFSIEHMSEASSERLETVLFDAVLSRFR